jgi:kynurenine 3-monooxygenase
MRTCGSWSEALAQFASTRPPNTDAIAAMALENFLEMRDTVRDPKFLLRKSLSFELERRFPDRFIPRYSMVMFHHEIPYRLAFERGELQAVVLRQLTDGVETLEQISTEAMREAVHAHLPPIFGGDGRPAAGL